MIRAMCNRKDLRVKFLEKTGYAGGAAYHLALFHVLPLSPRRDRSAIARASAWWYPFRICKLVRTSGGMGGGPGLLVEYIIDKRCLKRVIRMGSFFVVFLPFRRPLT